MRIFTTLCFLCLSVSLIAQIEKGSISFFGQTSISQSWYGDRDRNDFDFDANPGISFMISDRFMLGAAIGTGLISNLETVNLGNLIQPEVRYYFNPQAKNKFFAGFVGSFDLGDMDNSNYGFRAGANRFINSNIALEGLASYQIFPAGSDALTLDLYLRPFLSRGDRDAWKEANPNAQKGDYFVGNSTARITLIRDRWSFELSPSVGTFINERWLWGDRLGAIFQINDISRFTSLSNEIYLRHFLQAAPKPWRWFGEVGLYAQDTRLKVDDFVETKGDGVGLQTTWGANIFLSSHLALEVFGRVDYYFGTYVDRQYEEIGFTNPGSNLFQNFRGKEGDDRLRLLGGIQLNYFISRKK